MELLTENMCIEDSFNGIMLLVSVQTRIKTMNLVYSQSMSCVTGGCKTEMNIRKISLKFVN